MVNWNIFSDALQTHILKHPSCKEDECGRGGCAKGSETNFANTKNYYF